MPKQTTKRDKRMAAAFLIAAYTLPIAGMFSYYAIADTQCEQNVAQVDPEQAEPSEDKPLRSILRFNNDSSASLTPQA